MSHPFDYIHWKDHSKGEGVETRKNGKVSPGEDEKTQLLSQGLNLLLAARGRVLTLSEQRVSLHLTQIIAAYFLSIIAPFPSDPATDFTLYFNLH